MAAISWKSGVSGAWTTASDWSGGVVPGAADTVSISVAGGFGITLASAATVQSLTLAGSRATLIDYDSLQVSGTLGLDAGTFDLHGGTLSGGTVVSQGGTFYGNGTLSGVTWQGTLTVAPPLLRFSDLTITNGITLEGAGGTGEGTLNAAAPYGPIVDFIGPTLLDNATMDIGGYYFHGYLRFYNGPVTFGSHLLITQTYHEAIIKTPEYSLTNMGTIAASMARGYLNLFGGATFTNQGAILIGNSEMMLEQESIFVNTGLISASGGAEIYAFNTFTSSGSVVVGGTGSRIEILAASFTNLKSGTLTGGSFEVDAGGALALPNNATISVDSAVVTLSGLGSVLQSLDTATNQQVALESTLATIASGGTLSVLGARNFTVGTAGGTFHDNGLLRLGGGTFSAAALTVGSGGSLVGAGTVAGSVTNSGLVDASGGNLTAPGLSGVVGSTLTSGRIEADARSILQLPDNVSLTTDAAGITLVGTGSVIQSLNTGTSTDVSLDTTLATIASGGTLSLLRGRSFAVGAAGGSLSDAGLLSLNAGTVNAKTLTVAGTLSGAGAVTSALSLGGTVVATGGTLAISGAVSGAGRLTLSSGAALSVTGSLAASGGITLASSGASLLALGSAGKVTAPISGFGTGGTIGVLAQALASVAWSQTSTSGGALTLRTSGGFSSKITLLGSFTQADFKLGTDGHGGSDITFAGTAAHRGSAPPILRAGGGGVSDVFSAAVQDLFCVGSDR